MFYSLPLRKIQRDSNRFAPGYTVGENIPPQGVILSVTDVLTGGPDSRTLSMTRHATAPLKFLKALSLAPFKLTIKRYQSNYIAVNPNDC